MCAPSRFLFMIVAWPGSGYGFWLVWMDHNHQCGSKVGFKHRDTRAQTMFGFKEISVSLSRKMFYSWCLKMSLGNFKQGVALHMCAQSRFLFVMVVGSGYGFLLTWLPCLLALPCLFGLHWALAWLAV